MILKRASIHFSVNASSLLNVVSISESNGQMVQILPLHLPYISVKLFAAIRFFFSLFLLGNNMHGVVSEATEVDAINSMVSEGILQVLFPSH